MGTSVAPGTPGLTGACQKQRRSADPAFMGPSPLAEAFDRLDAFVAVQRGAAPARAGGYTLEAVRCLQEAVGIEDAERDVLRERLAELEDSVAPATNTREQSFAGTVLIGVILGLLAAQGEPATSQVP